jgi:K(+)-stimulated pyrophosphate-energized sodium pump
MEASLSFFSYSPLIGIAGFAFAVLTYFWVKRQPAGNARMTEISGLIEEGSMTFLKKEYSILVVFLAIVAALLGWKLGTNTAICYLTGAGASMLCGFIGMKAATKANVRTAEAAANSGQPKALSVAFFGGSVMGMTVGSLGLIGVAIAYKYLTNSTNIEALNGFCHGCFINRSFCQSGWWDLYKSC